MASVWLAAKRAEGGFVRVCALKRVHPYLAQKNSFVDMFLDEARIAARIDHPNVCQVFDYGSVDGTPYIAMEYLAGVSLSEVLEALAAVDGKAELVALCSIVAEAAAGLHAAHELRGDDGESLRVVHRDISPQNLFLTFDGVVKVLDFGIASARDKVHETDTGEVKGKFAYMAPEQMRGRKVDRRADVWSLGVVLWELLTRRRLFRRKTQAETMDAVLRARFEAPSRYDETLPSELDDLLRQALEPDPAARFSTMAELAAALQRGLDEPLWGRRQLEGWVNRLFPKGREAAASRVEATLSKAKRTYAAAAPEPKPPSSRPSTETAPTVAGTVRPAARRTSRVGVALALAALFGVGGGAVWALSRDDVAATEEDEDEALPDRSALPTVGRASPMAPIAPVPIVQEEAEAEPSVSTSGESTPRRSQRRPAPTETMSAAAMAPNEEPPRTGCIRLGLGVRARIGSETIEGPARVEVPAGTVRVTLLEDPPVRRTLQVSAGRSCERLTRSR